MTIAGFFNIGLILALVLLAALPLGAFMADVFENRRTFLTPVIGPIERLFYRAAGVDPEVEQKWHEFAISMVIFGGGCFFLLYALLRLQVYLRLNPQGFPGVPPDLSFNIAISFITNANWQAYAGETTLSHFSQMAGLTANNFMDSAAATAIALALTRAIGRNESPTIGNFWVDMTRATLYVMLPLSLIVALAFTALGVPQTLQASIEATTLEGAKQTIALGPVAGQEAIKLIGDNGGGFFTPIPRIRSKTRAPGRTSSKFGASLYCRPRSSSPSDGWSATSGRGAPCWSRWRSFSSLRSSFSIGPRRAGRPG